MKKWGFSKKNDVYESWPKTESGEPVKPVFLQKTAGDEIGTGMIVNMLKAYGISVLQKYPENGEFGKVMLGQYVFGVELYVPETQLDDAKNLLSEDAVFEEEDSQ